MSDTNDDAAAREGAGHRPPGRPPGAPDTPPAGLGGPTSPAGTDAGEAPETGGYDRRPPAPMPDNAKGGYGTG